MVSDWWFLAMLGSAASTAAGALGTAASGALSSLGSLAGTAASGIGTAASSALNSLGLGSGAGAAGAGAGGAGGGAAASVPASVSAPASAGGAGGLGIPASEATASGTGAVMPNAPSASAVPTSNLPPAAGGYKIGAETPTAPNMAGSDPMSSILGQISPGSGTPISTVSMPKTPYGAQPAPPLLAAQGPGSTLGELTNMPELGQYGAGAAQYPTPTTFQLPSQAGGPGAPGPSLLSQIAQGAKGNILGRIGVTDPTASVPSMLQQVGLSQVAGGPYLGYNPQAGFLSNLGGAVKQRALSSLWPESGGRSPQDMEEAVRLLLAQRGGPPARTLPVMGSLPGGNQFSW